MHPLQNPGLELTGPWHPLDMAFNALNSPAPMNMPDFEDASPPHFQPDGTPSDQPVAIFAALQNAKEIFEGRWNDQVLRGGEEGQDALVQDRHAAGAVADALRPSAQHPHRLRPRHGRRRAGARHRSPSSCSGRSTTYDALKRAGTGVYFYIPKMQTPREALIVEKTPGAAGRASSAFPPAPSRSRCCTRKATRGRYLPGDRLDPAPPPAGHERRPLGLPRQPHRDVEGRSERRLPDPQTIGMATPNMIAYQRYNALMMLMAGHEGRRAHARLRPSAAWRR